MNNILILYDNRGYTASSLADNAKGTIDVNLLKKNLQTMKYNVEIKGLHELTFPSKYKDWYIVYPSSEDPGLFYKNYIEDIILRLEIDGAILLPDFKYFRAHHNKVFMELYRTCLTQEYNTLKSFSIYSIKDLKRKMQKTKLTYPVVVKSSAGAGSLGVKLAKDEQDLVKIVSKMGRVFFTGICYTNRMKIRQWLGNQKRKLLKYENPKKTIAREKLIIQSFVPNLHNDYKVLVFGEKYYILRRQVRTGDFRASGSGKLEFPYPIANIEESVLEYAKGAYEQLNTPLLSIDIAYDGKTCHMVEFQCLNFGPYTLQFSQRYYIKKEKWLEIQGKSVLEDEMANAFHYFIEKRK